jgi:hypothetical protein
MLVLMVLPVLVAALIVVVRNGGVRGIALQGFRHVWLVWLAGAVQFVRVSDPAWAGPLLRPLGGLWPVLVTWLLAALFAAVNVASMRRAARIGLTVLVLGFTLNSLTVALNGGMPFSVAAARSAGFSAVEIAEPKLGHPKLTADTTLQLFSDRIPVPGLQRVVSVGDLLMLLGGTWVLATLAAVPARRSVGKEPALTG